MLEFTKHHEDTQGILFCVRAVTKDDLHYGGATNMLCVQSGQMIATDGHRIHIYKLMNPLADGLYRVIVKTKVKITIHQEIDPPQFPDWERIIPQGDCVEIPQLNFTEVTDLSQAFARIVRALPEDVTLNYRFLEDLADSVFTAKIFHQSNYTPVVFTDDNKQALIMPMKV